MINCSIFVCKFTNYFEINGILVVFFCNFATYLLIIRMTLHIFNPEHDIALASNLSNFTAPHAGRQLRHDLGFIPALWAEDGDSILVENVTNAEYSYMRLQQSLKRSFGETASRWQRNVVFLTKKQLISMRDTTALDPWGWDRAITTQLKRGGVGESLLPSAPRLEDIRLLSHRRTSAKLLPLLQQEGTLGESFECATTEEVEVLLQRYGRLVLKAPWSSSGRGLRFLDVERTPLAMHAGWLKNLLASQGSVMAEPFYHKAKDFGMEFSSSADGQIRYEGLSLFHTTNGAYTGNILATETTKREMISHYVSLELLDAVKEKICTLLPTILEGKYVGPFGVDMMIAEEQLHPCVEINLRRTMGHVALALTPTDDDVVRVMRIEYADGTYKLKIQRP